MVCSDGGNGVLGTGHPLVPKPSAGVLWFNRSRGSNFEEHVDGANKVVIGVMQGSGKRPEMYPGAVGPLCNSSHAPDPPILADRDGHWAAVMRQRSTIES